MRSCPTINCALLRRTHLLPLAGQFQLHTLQRAPAEVLRPLPGAPTTSLAARLQLLDSFPGPLSSSSKADKVRRGWLVLLLRVLVAR